MKLSIMKPLSASDLCIWLSEKSGFVEGGICEAVDKPESASEDDPFADIDEQ